MGTGFSCLLDQEIENEARQLNLSGSEYAPLLFLIARAITREGRRTSFGNAVMSVLSAHGLDPDQIASAFDEITKACAPHERREDFQTGASGDINVESYDSSSFVLRDWQMLASHLASRSAEISVQDDRETIFANRPPTTHIFQSGGREARDRVSAFGKYRGVTGGSEQFAEEKKSEIEREDRARR